MSTTRMLLSLVAVFAAGACSSHRQRPSAASEPPSDVTLQVTNHNFLDVTVLLLRDGQRIRIGLATGTSSQSFTIPARLIAQTHEIVLLGEAIGSNDRVRTEILTVLPGQRIEWTLESDLRRSSVGVY
jgi:hypothetical protein